MAPSIELVAMREEEFHEYVERTIVTYAADHVRDGQWTEQESLARARQETDSLLPEGLRTPDHFLYTVRSLPDHQRVGMIWLHLPPRNAFIYDLEIDEKVRGRGFGRSTMLAAEREARKRGAANLGLHVFGHNTVARRLYLSLGYREANLRMVKDLSPPAPTA